MHFKMALNQLGEQTCIMDEVTFTYLESTHIARIACILQAILVALEKELEEESGTRPNKVTSRQLTV